MDGKGDAAEPVVEPAMPDIPALTRELNRRLAEAAGGSLEELERTAKMVTTTAKAIQAVVEMAPRDDTRSRDEGLDAEGEQRLRDQVLGRLDALAATLELEGLAPCPACGRFEPARAGLEQLVGTGPEDARG
jgi:hypothetical protein